MESPFNDITGEELKFRRVHPMLMYQRWGDVHPPPPPDFVEFRSGELLCIHAQILRTLGPLQTAAASSHLCAQAENGPHSLGQPASGCIPHQVSTTNLCQLRQCSISKRAFRAQLNNVPVVIYRCLFFPIPSVFFDSSFSVVNADGPFPHFTIVFYFLMFTFFLWMYLEREKEIYIYFY